MTESIDNTHELHTKIQQYLKVPDNDIVSSIHGMIYSQIHIKIHLIESLLGITLRFSSACFDFDWFEDLLLAYMSLWFESFVCCSNLQDDVEDNRLHNTENIKLLAENKQSSL